MSDNRYTDEPGRGYRSSGGNQRASSRSGGSNRSGNTYTGTSYDRRYTRNNSVDSSRTQGESGYRSGSYYNPRNNDYSRGSSSYQPGSYSQDRSSNYSGSYRRDNSSYRSGNYRGNSSYEAGNYRRDNSSYQSGYSRSNSSYEPGSYRRDNSSYQSRNTRGNGSSYDAGSYRSGSSYQPGSYRSNGSSYQDSRYGRENSSYQRGGYRGDDYSSRANSRGGSSYQGRNAGYNGGTRTGNGGSGNPPRRTNKKRKIRPIALIMRAVLLLFAVLMIWGIACLFGKLFGKSSAAAETETSTELMTEAATVAETEPVRTFTPFTMGFAGDVMLQDALDRYKESGVAGLTSPGVGDFLESMDFMMLNEEYVYGTSTTPMEGKQYTYQVDPTYASALKEMGVDLVSLANNHTLDYGSEALSQTFAALTSVGINYVGAGNTLDEAAGWKTYQLGGANVAFLAGSRVLPTIEWSVENTQPGIFSCYDTKLMIQQIKAAKHENDLVIVYMHWGDLESTTPTDYQKEMAREFIDAGADLIVGSHAHVFQGIEYYKGVPIVYNLGNFIYKDYLEQSALLQVDVDSELNLSLKLVPIAGSNYRAYVQDDQAAQDALSYLGSLCNGVSIDAEGNVTATADTGNASTAVSETSAAAETQAAVGLTGESSAATESSPAMTESSAAITESSAAAAESSAAITESSAAGVESSASGVESSGGSEGAGQ